MHTTKIPDKILVTHTLYSREAYHELEIDQVAVHYPRAAGPPFPVTALLLLLPAPLAA